MIHLPSLGDLEEDLWLALLEVAERHPSGWTLIGGQMVLLHALEHGVSPPRISRDLDLVVNARALSPTVPGMAKTLEEMGFALGEISFEGTAHRFTRGKVAIDVLAPDGVGGKR